MIFILDRQERVINTLKNNNGLDGSTPYFDDVLLQDLSSGAETFSFQTLGTSKVVSDLVVGNYIAFLKNGKYKLFQIVQTEELHEEVVYTNVYCECAGLELINKVFRKRSLPSATLRKFMESLLDDTGWSVGKLDATFVDTMNLDLEDSTVYSTLQNVIQKFKGELEFRCEINNGRISSKFVDVHKYRGKVTGKRFEFGKDIEGLVRKTDSTELYTALIGKGKNGINFKDIAIDGINKPVGQDFIGDAESFNRYNNNGYHIMGLFEFETESPQELLRETYNQLQKVKNPKIEYEVSVALLGQLIGQSWNTVDIGDTVSIVDNSFNPPIHLMARVSVLETSITDPQKDKCTLANFVKVKTNITDAMRDIAKELEDYVDKTVDGKFPIKGEDIEDGAVSGDKIHQSSITVDHLQAGSIDADKIQANSIKTEHLQADSIESKHIKAEQIETEHLKAGLITADKIDAGTINSNHIETDTINAHHLQVDSVEAQHIKSGSIEADHLKAGIISADHITSGSITTDKLDANSITTDKLQANSIDTDKLQANSVTAEKIQAGAIDADKIKVDSIDANHIKSNSISTEHLMVDAIDADKIQANAIETKHLQADVINADKIQAEAIESEHIKAGAIESEHISSGSITSDKIEAGSISADKLQTNSVTTDKLEANSVTADKIKAGEIDAEHIKSDSIDTNHLKSNIIESGHIKADQITAEHLATDSVTADSIKAGSITAEEIATGSITAGSGIIAEGAIGNAEISTLDAGKITAGTIDSSKITIAGQDGHLRLKGNRLQVFEGLGTQAKERVSLGDVNGNGTTYGLIVRGKDGKTILLDENGVTEQGITDGSITNDKISDSAEIDGAKLNINSVVNKINEDGTEVIKGTKIEVDGTSLTAKLSNIDIKQNEDRESIKQNSASIKANENSIKLKVNEQTYIEDKKNLNSTLQLQSSEIATMKDKISLKVEQTDINNAVDGVKEGFTEDIVAINSRIDDLILDVGGAISDGIIEEAETITIQNCIVQLNKEKTQLVARYDYIYGLVNLKNPHKENLKVAKDNFIDSQERLIATINRIIADKVILPSEKVEFDTQSQEYGVAISTLNRRMDEAIDAVSSDKVSVAKAEIKVTTDGISQRVSSTETTTKKLGDDLNNLEVGAINLLKCNDITITNNGSKIDYAKSGKVTIDKGEFYYEGIYWYVNKIIEKASDFILSFKVKRLSGVLNSVGGHIDNAITTKKIVVDGKEISNKDWSNLGKIESLNDGNFHSVVVYFNYKKTANDVTQLYIQPNRGTDTSAKVEIQGLKVELGSKVSTWTPAPEDLSEEISKIDSKVETTKSQIASIETNLDSITSKVESTETSITTINNKLSTNEQTKMNGLELLPQSYKSNSDNGFIARSGYSKPTYANGEISITGQCWLETDYIKIDRSKPIYWQVDKTTSSKNLFYFGIERYDKDKKVVAGETNAGTRYFINQVGASGVVEGYYNEVEKTTAYIKLRVLTDWNNTGSATTVIKNISIKQLGALTTEELTTRVKSAESKITEDAITNTVKKNFYTKTETEGQITSKGYQTASDVKQTVDKFELKFQESGGYNLLLNTGFKVGTKHWGNNGGTLSIVDENTSPTKKAIKVVASGQWKGIYQHYTPTKLGKYTVSFYGKADANLELSIGQESSTQTRVALTTTWKKFSYTFDRTSLNKNAYVFYPVTSGTYYLHSIMVEIGDLTKDWTPNPSEIYDGITTIDKDGITVESTNVKSKTAMSADGFKITRTTDNKDVFKVDSSGNLQIEGKITVSSGSNVDAGISQSIKDGASAGTTANNTINSNKGTWDKVTEKAKVFTSQPVPPYAIGDLWVQGTNGEIMKCKTARSSGSYNSADWEKGAKYTDDSAVNNLQIGGRNLIRKEGLQLNGVTGTFNTSTNTWSLVAPKGSSSWGYGLTIISSKHNIIIPFGKCAIYSFEIKVPKQIKWNFDVNNSLIGTSTGTNDNDNTDKRSTSSKTITKPNEWVKCWQYIENTSESKNPNKLDLKDASSLLGLVTTDETGNTSFEVRNFKVELGNKATDWTPAPEDVDSAIADASKKGQDSLDILSDIASDSKLTPSEKLTTKKEWDQIAGEKGKIVSEANKFGVSVSDYEAKYNSLNNYLSPLLSSLTTTSNITGSTFRGNFTNYYNARQDVLNGISTKAKALADGASQKVDGLIIGGTNLIKNSDFTKKSGSTPLYWRSLGGNVGWDVNNTNDALGGKPYIYFKNNDTTERFVVSDRFKLKPNTDYVCSFYESNDAGALMDVYVLASNSITNVSDTSTSYDGVYSIKDVCGGNFQQRREFKFKTGNSVKSGYIRIDNNIGGGKVVRIALVKLEEGNKATPWSATPEEIQAEINSTKTIADSLQKDVNAWKHPSNTTSIDGGKIYTGSISTEKLSVIARNKVNNFSISGNLEGWTNNSAMVLERSNDFGNINAKITSKTDIQILSNWFEIDPTKMYKISMSVYGTGSNSKYFGLNGSTDGSNNNSALTEFNVSSRSWGGETTNPYFWYVGKASTGGWKHIEAYVLPSNIHTSQIPTLSSGKVCDRYYRMKPTQKYLRLRFLNFSSSPSYGDGTTNYVSYWNNVSITEVGAGTVHAESITAGTIHADRINADTIVSKVNGASTTISGSKITTGTITASHIHADGISADKLNIGLGENGGYSKNPMFKKWSGSYPDGTSSWASGGLTKVSVDSRNVAQFTCASNTDNGMHLATSFFGAGLNLDGAQYFVAECKFRLTSGTNPNGSAMLFDIYRTDNSYERMQMNLNRMGTSLTTNTWYTCKQVFKLADGNVAKTYKHINGYCIANWSSSSAGGFTAKTIQIASVNLYKATEQDYLTQTWTNGTEINGDKIKTGTLSASKITTGTLDASKVTVANLNAGNIKTGTLDASKATITNINASNITTGTLSASRIASNSIDASKISVTDLTNLANLMQDKNDVEKVYDLLYRDHAISNRYPISDVEANSEFLFELYCKTKDSSTTLDLNAYVFIHYSDGSTGYPAKRLAIASECRNWVKRSVSVNIGAFTSGKTPIAYTLVLQIPESPSDSKTQNWQVKQVVVRRKNAGNLLVDGAVTANKMNVKGLTVSNGSTNTLAISSSGNVDINANSVKVNVNGSYKNVADISLKVDKTETVINQIRTGTRCHNLGAKINYSSFTASNEGEMYIHGFDSNNAPADVNPQLTISGVARNVTRGMVNPNGDFGTYDVYLCTFASGGNSFGVYYHPTEKRWRYKGLIGYSDSGTISVESNYWCYGVFKMSSAEVFDYAYLLSEPVRLNKIAQNTADLESRISSAESKITNDAIINTVKNTFYTKSDIDGKKYQTESQVKQTADNLKLSFTSSGAYNLLKNGALKAGTKYWGVQEYQLAGGNLARNFNVRKDSWTGNEPALQVQINNMTSGEYGFIQNIPTVVGKKYVFTCYLAGHRSNKNIIIRGTSSSASGWLTNKTYGDLYGGEKLSDWTKVVLPFTAQRTTTGIQLCITKTNGSDGYIWAREMMVSEGSDWTPYSPNASEIYDGVTTIDADGVKTSHSDGSYSMMGRDGFEWYNGSTKNRYHCLLYAGEYTCYSEQTVRISLPAEFRGKPFKIVTSVKKINIGYDMYAHKAPLLSFYANADKVDRNAGWMEIYASVRAWNQSGFGYGALIGDESRENNWIKPTVAYWVFV